MKDQKQVLTPEHMQKIGKRGGKATFKRIGSVGMSKLAKKRWDKSKTK